MLAGNPKCWSAFEIAGRNFQMLDRISEVWPENSDANQKLPLLAGIFK
jgi:hypothetical protein